MTIEVTQPVSDERLEVLREAYEHLAKNPIWHGTDRQLKDAEHASLFEELQSHRQRICRECEGRTVIPNQDARWSEDYADGRRTGQYSTNDPEEIECPRCNGVGYEPPERPTPAPRLQMTYSDEEPF